MKIVSNKPHVVRRTKTSNVSTNKKAAEEAVAKFEEMRSELADMEEDFSEKFPEAHTERVAIDTYRSAVLDQVKRAKDLVRLAGDTIGDFKYQAKHSTAGFDGDKLLDICVANEDASLLLELAKVGALKLKVIQKPATIYSDHHPDDAKKMMGAWEESKPLTPAITVPKI